MAYSLNRIILIIPIGLISLCHCFVKIYAINKFPCHLLCTMNTFRNNSSFENIQIFRIFVARMPKWISFNCCFPFGIRWDQTDAQPNWKCHVFMKKTAFFFHCKTTEMEIFSMHNEHTHNFTRLHMIFKIKLPKCLSQWNSIISYAPMAI